MEGVGPDAQSLMLYRRLGRVATTRELDVIRDEMLARYWPLPGPVERLLEFARLRFTAQLAAIVSLLREESQLVVRFGSDWSHVGAARTLQPRDVSDPLRPLAGGLTTAPTRYVPACPAMRRPPGG